jgi:hypothetical protein
LLFAAASEEAERDAERQVARLDALRFIRAAVSWPQARPKLGHDVFPRARPDLIPGRLGREDASLLLGRPNL